MKRTYIKRVILAIFAGVMIFLYLVLSGNYFFVNTNDTKVRADGFYLEDRNTLDVVLMGASETYCNFAPGIAYDKYGFTSYTMGIPAGACELTQYQLKDILQYQTPQLIVLEINSFLYGSDEALFDDVKLRATTDNMPLTKNKMDIIQSFPKEDPILSYYMPFFKYHGTTDYGSASLSMKTTIQMKQRGHSLLKGIYTTPAQVRYTDLYDMRTNKEVEELNPTAEKTLIDLLDYCRKNEINVLFARFPHLIFDEERVVLARRAERVGQIVEEFGYDFVNFEKDYEAIGLDLQKDFSDPGHMNVYGQYKFTEYLGKVLCEQYDVKPVRLSAVQQKEWQECADYTKLFMEYADQCIKDDSEQEGFYERVDIIEKLQNIKTTKTES